jgi:hypothetical protein
MKNLQENGSKMRKLNRVKLMSNNIGGGKNLVLLDNTTTSKSGNIPTKNEEKEGIQNSLPVQKENVSMSQETIEDVNDAVRLNLSRTVSQQKILKNTQDTDVEP